MGHNNTLTQGETEGMSIVDAGASEATRAAREKMWVGNALTNRPEYKKGNPPLAGLAVFIVAAGPSLEKNVKQLKKISKRGLILCMDAAFKFVVAAGVKPEYCMCIDGDERMIKMIEGLDTSKTTLIAMASTSPTLINAWEGPKFFLRCLGGARDIDDKLIAVAREVEALKDMKAGDIINPLEDIRVNFAGLADKVITGGNVTGAAHSFAVDHLRAANIIFVGADYSWTEQEKFYAGGIHAEFGAERQDAEKMFTHPTPEGVVCTNVSMFSFKRWHEDMALASHVPCINATEGGILGVNREGKTVDGWKHLTLAEAIAGYAPK